MWLVFELILLWYKYYYHVVVLKQRVIDDIPRVEKKQAQTQNILPLYTNSTGVIRINILLFGIVSVSWVILTYHLLVS